MSTRALMISALALSLAYAGCDGDEGDGDGDVDADVDGDVDGDGDTDVDSDSDVDGDTDTDTDTDTDSDTDADTDADLDADFGDAACEEAPRGVPVSDSPDGVRGHVAWTGSLAGVAWATLGPSPLAPSQVYFSALDGSLATTVDDVLVAETELETDTVQLDLAWDGTNLHLVWSEGSGDDPGPVRHQVIDGAGALVGEPVQVSEGDGATTWLSLERGDGEMLVAWTDHRTGNADLHARYLDADGPVGAELLLDGGAGEQTLPAVGYKDGSFLVVYMDRQPPTGFYGVTLDDSGASDPFEVLLEADPEIAPILVPTPEGYSLLWRSRQGLNTTLWLLQLSAEGIADGDPVAIDGDLQSYDATSDGEDIVLFVVHGELGMASHGFLQRIEPAGTPTGAPLLLSCAETVSTPAIAWTGEDFLLGWTEPDEDIYIASRLWVGRQSY